MTGGDRQAVLVLGMHRSGTSAVAGALNLLGAAMPARPLNPAPDNPSGFWETAYVLGVNDRILSASGHTWFDCLDFESEALDAPSRASAMTFVLLCVMLEFSRDPLLLIKDPRLSLVLDLWLAALHQTGIAAATLLVVRHPAEVVASLAQRDGLPAALSTALWLRYMLAAEFASRGQRRHVLPYDGLLRDWRSALHQAGRATGIAWPLAFDSVAGRMEGFLNPGLRHHRALSSARQMVGVPLGTWADEVYETLLGLDGPASAAGQQRLDHVHAAFRDWCHAQGRDWAGGLLRGNTIRTQPRFGVPAQWEAMAARLELAPVAG
jgi:hypothetical protein